MLTPIFFNVDNANLCHQQCTPEIEHEHECLAEVSFKAPSNKIKDKDEDHNLNTINNNYNVFFNIPMA